MYELSKEFIPDGTCDYDQYNKCMHEPRKWDRLTGDMYVQWVE